MAIELKNKKWKKEAEQLKKVQVNFSFVPSVDKALRHEAIEKELTPSNFLRELLGLDASKTVRQRLGVNFTEDDFLILAERYGIDVNDRNEIKKRATEEISLRYNNS